MQTIEEFIHTYENNNTWISELNSVQYETFCRIIKDWNSQQTASLRAELALGKQQHLMEGLKLANERIEQLETIMKIGNKQEVIRQLQYENKALKEENERLDNDFKILFNVKVEVQSELESFKKRSDENIIGLNDLKGLICNEFDEKNIEEFTEDSVGHSCNLIYDKINSLLPSVESIKNKGE